MSDREKWASIGVLKRSPTTDREVKLDKDLEAYKRLRHDGLQPRSVDGSAKLETTVESHMDIDYGDCLSQERIRENKNLIADIEAEMR